MAGRVAGANASGVVVRRNGLKRVLMATAATVGGLLIPQMSSAHTDALGFVISPDPVHPGKFITKIYYGTYDHGGTPSAEGSAQIALNNLVVATQPFALVPGYSHVANGTVPSDLVLGTNYFFVNSSTSGLGTTPFSSGTNEFQFATFDNLDAGNYTFGYVSGPLTQQWTPLSPAINAGSFTVTSAGTLGGIGGVVTTPDIDTALAVYTTTQLAAGSVTSNFAGGTLQASTTQAIATNFKIGAAGGTIDTNNQTLTLNGTLSDQGATPGKLTVKGGGTVVATQANTYSGGTYVDGGVLRLTNLQGAGTGTIHLVDPQIDLATAGTNTNAYSLDVKSPAVNDPSIFNNSSGGTVVLAGAITTGTGNNANGQPIDPVQYVTFTGNGTTQLTNTANSWTGTTTVNSGATLQGTNATISGSSIVDNGTLAYVQAGSGTVAQGISGSGVVTVAGVGAGNALTFSGALTQTGGIVVNDPSTVRLTGSLNTGGNVAFNATAAATLDNQGTVAATVGGVPGTATFSAGGTVINGGAGNATAAISGSYAALYDTGGALGVTNFGVLSASSYAIVAQGGNAANPTSLQLTNTGKIVGGAVAVVANDQTTSNTITNSGIIQAGSYSGGTITAGTAGSAIIVRGSSTVANNAGGKIVGGTGTGSGDNYGVQTLSGGTLTLTNAATAQIVGGYAGVEVAGASTITNNGLIGAGTYAGSTFTAATTGVGVSLLGGGTVGNAAGATITGGVTGVNVAAGGSIDNSGAINATARAATGMSLSNNSSAIALAQGGTIINSAGGSLIGYNGIDLSGTGASQVRNAGLIQGNGPNANGIIAVAGTTGSTIVNTGTIEVIGRATGSGAWGIGLINAGNSIVNTGTIAGDSAVIFSDAPATTGTQTLVNGAGGKLDGLGASVASSGGVSVTFTNYGTASGAVKLASTGASTITLQAGSTTAPITTGTGADSLTIYTGRGTSGTAVTDATSGLVVQNAGTLAAPVVGTVDLGAGTNTLTLAGTGDGSAANGVGGTLATSTLTNVTKLVKQDAGIWTLTGTAGATDFTGGTTISGGTLVSASNTALGTGAVVDNAALSFNGASGAFANAVSGSGTIAVSNVGAGNTLTFNGALTSTGGMTIGDTSTVAINAGANGGVLENGAGARTLNITGGVATNTTANTFGSGLYINTTTGTTTVGVSSGATLASTYTVAGNRDGVTALSNSAITNRGTISASYNAGVALAGGGTIDNYGAITGGNAANGYGVAISGTALGTLTNEVGGKISGTFGGVAFQSTGTGTNAASLSNAGQISGYNGIQTSGTGAPSVSNLATGQIVGSNIAIYGVPAITISNLGTIGTGTLSGATYMPSNGGTALYLTGGGTITNGSVASTTAASDAALIQGGGGAIATAGGTASVTNYGQILSTGIGQAVVIGAGGTVTNGSATNAAAAIKANNGTAVDGQSATLVNVTNYGLLQGYYSGAGQNGSGDFTLHNYTGGVVYGTTNLGAYNIGTGALTVTNDAGGKIVGAVDGVYAASGTALVSNAGTIGTGTVSGTGVFTVGGSGFGVNIATGTVTNTGTINATGASVYQTSTTGTLNLVNTGTIGGAARALDPDDTVVASGAGTVLNSGTITAPSYYAVSLLKGGTVTNAAAGVISAGTQDNTRYGVDIAGGSGTINNYGIIRSTSTDQSRGIVTDDNAATINLYAGSTTGAITTGSANDALTLYNGRGTTAAATTTTYLDAVTGLTGGTITLQQAGALAGAVVGAVNLGGGANTVLLAGTGDGTAANGAVGSLALTGGGGLGVLTKQDTGTWTLTGTGNAGLTRINAGVGGTSGSGGLLVFSGTGVTSDIYVNGATIRADGTGGFGTGTIYAVDPTMQFNSTTTFANPIVLQSTDSTNDPTRLQVGNGVTATLTGQISQGGGSATQPLIFELIPGGVAGTFVLTNGANTYNGLTTINTGTTVRESNTGTALGSVGALINSGATLELANTNANPAGSNASVIVGPTTFTGTGTLVKSGTGYTAFGNNGNVNVSLSQGALIDVQAGLLAGSASFQGLWTNNKASLNVAAGATFNGVEGTIFVDALTGSGTVLGGQGGVARTTTVGVADGSGTFAGSIGDFAAAGAGSRLALTKQGTGTQTLTGANTYTGATTISGGTLALGGTGTLTASTITDNATFDIAGHTGGASVLNLLGSGATTLGANTLTITAANGTYAGSFTGTGGLTVNGGGTYVLTGTGNSYAGATTIGTGETLQGTTASLSPSSTVTDNGTLAFVQTGSGTFTPGILGSGVVRVSGLTGTSAVTFAGALTNAGGLTLGTAGNATISGSVSNASSTGAVQVSAFGDVLTVASGGSITSTQSAAGGFASAVYGTPSNFTVTNAGTITAPGNVNATNGSNGIYAASSVTLNNTGKILGVPLGSAAVYRSNGVIALGSGSIINNTNATLSGGALTGTPTSGGVITGGWDGLFLNGGTVFNAGDIAGNLQVAIERATTVTNYATGRLINGISLQSGVQVTNAGLIVRGSYNSTTAAITAGTTGPAVGVTSGTVANNAGGRIIGGSSNNGNTDFSYGVLSTGALTLTNDAAGGGLRAGQIVGGYTGVEVDGIGTITNTGLIGSGTLDFTDTGTTVTSGYTVGGTDGVRLLGGGSVTNNAGALIRGSGGSGVYTDSATTATLINSGTVAAMQGFYTFGTSNQALAVTNTTGGFIVGTAGDGVHNGGTGLTTVTSNAGSIVGSANGVTANAAVDITNTGLIGAGTLASATSGAFTANGSGRAIYAGTGGTVRNTGGSIQGGTQASIYSNAGTLNVNNTGAISTVGTGSVDGITSQGVLTLINTGTRSAAGTYTAGTISAPAASGVAFVGAGSSVTNSGRITGGNNASYGYGVQANASGTITNQAVGLIEGGYGGILAQAIGVTVTNSAVLRGTGATSYGIYETQGTLNLTNNAGGQIVGASYGILASSAATIGNSGLIGAGTLTFNAGANRYDFTRGGSDGIQALGGGTITNNAGGVITGGGYGVVGSSTLVQISNAATAQIVGAVGGLYTTGPMIVTNAGLIGRGTLTFNAATSAYDFGYTNGNAVTASGPVTIDNTGVFDGTVSGSNALNVVNRVGGVLKDGDGIYSTGTIALVNAGTITATLNSGVGSNTTGNNGQITVTNAVGGIISGGTDATYGGAIQLGGVTGMTNVVDNYGTLNAGGNGKAIYAFNNNINQITLRAGSTTGAIGLSGGADVVSLYTGTGATFTGRTYDTVAKTVGTGTIVDATHVLIQNAGTNAAAAVGTIALGGGSNTINLRGLGTDTAAGGSNGRQGTLDLSTVTGLTTLVKLDTGAWTLMGATASPAAVIYAGSGPGTVTPAIGSGGTLTFNGTTGLTGAIYVNSATIVEGTSGAFGTGTIHAVDPTIVLANGTNANNYVLDVATPASSNPTTFQTANGNTVTLTGSITTGTGNNINNQPIDSNQPVTFALTPAGGTAGFVLANATGTANAWSGATTINAGVTLTGTTATISGGSIVDNGVLDYNQTTTGSVAQVISGSGRLIKDGTGTVTLTQHDTYTGGTAVLAGTLVAATVNGSYASDALSSGTVAISQGATVRYDNPYTTGNPGPSSAQIYVSTNTFTGAGTLAFTGGAGSLIVIDRVSGTSDVALGMGGLVDVRSGAVLARGTGVFAGNQGGLAIAAGASFDGAAAAISVDALTGAGTYTGNGTLSVGVAGGTGTFSGTIGNETGGGVLALTKAGAGTQTLTGTDTYTGATSITGGTLALAGTGSIANTRVDVGTGSTFAIAGLTDGVSPSVSTSIVSLTGSGTTALGANTLRLTNASGVYAGTITDSPTTAGTLDVVGGTFTYGNDNIIADNATVTVRAPATLDLGGHSDTIGTLNLYGTLQNGGRLTAANYNLYGGSTVNDALGGGSLNIYGATTLNSQTDANPVNIYNGGTLTLGSAERIGDLSRVNIQGGGALVLGGAETIGSLSDLQGSGGTVDLKGALLTVGGDNSSTAFSGAIGNTGAAGANGVTKIGTGTLTLAGANTFTGTTTINGGTLALQNGAAIADTGAVVVNMAATLQLLSSETIATLAGAGAVNLGGTTLTLGTGNTSSSFDGVIAGVGGNVTLNGTGSLTLSNANTYTGATTINGGSFVFGGSNVLADASTLNINTGTAALGANADTIATLNLTNASLTGTGKLTATNSYNLTGATVLADLGGTGTLNQNGGTSTLTGASGSTTVAVNGGTLRLGAAERLADTAALTIQNGATFNLNGFDETIGTALIRGTLNGTGNTLTAGSYTLDGGTFPTSYAPVVNANLGTGALTVQGKGVSTLNGTAAAATVNVTGGTLRLGADDRLADAAVVSVASGAILDLGGHSDTVATLALNGTLAGGPGTLTAATYTLNGATVSGNLGTGVVVQQGGTSLLNGTAGAATANVTGGTLQLGASDRLIDTAVVTVAAGAALDVRTFNDTVDTLNLNGTLNGSGTLSAATYNLNAAVVNANLGTGTLNQLGGVSLLNGAAAAATVNVNAGTLQLGAADRLADTAAVTVQSGAALDVQGFSDTVGGLSLGGALNGTGTLTAATYALTGGTANANLGTGVLTQVSGVSTLSGTSAAAVVNVVGGTLALGASDRLADTATVAVLTGGTLDLAANGDTVGSLTLAGTLAGTGTLTAATYTLTGGTANANLGAGTLTQQSGASTLNGTSAATSVNVNGGSLALGASDRLADTAVVAVASGAALNLGANSDTVGSVALAGTLNGTGTLTAATYTLTAGTANANLGTGTLTQAAGVSTLNGTAAATTVAINGGTLVTGAAERIADTAAVTIAGGAQLTLGGAETIGSLNGAGNVVLGANTLTTGVLNANAAFAGVASGTGGLTKVGTATLTLSGANTYTGATMINAGTLAVAGGNALADLSAVTIASGATLALSASETIGSLNGAGAVVLGANTLTTGVLGANATFAGVASGTGGLTKVGTGTLTVSGSNTYTGATTVNAGTLALGASNVLADASAVGVATGATLALGANSDTVASLALAGTLSGTGTLTAATYTLNGAAVNGNLGAGTLTQAGGTSVLSGTAAATTVAVNAGTLTLGASDRLADAAAVSVATGAVLNLAGFTDTVGTAALNGTVNGTGTLTAATYTLNGAAVNGNLGTGTLTQAGGTSVLTGSSAALTVAINAGTLRLGASDRLADAGAVTVATGAVLDLGAFTDTVGTAALNGTVNGTGTLTAATYTLNGAAVNGNLGAGTLTQAGGTSVLSGTSAALTVAINAGTLRTGANERLADAGAVTVATGATLDLAGATETVGSVNGAGAVALGAGRLVLAGAGASSLGALTGTGNVDKTGTGALTLANAYAATGSINLLAGTTAFTGTSAGALRVAGGTLTGTGMAAGGLTLTAGTVAPGTAASPFGTLTVGSLSASGGTYAVDFGGVATGYAADLIRVNGAAALSGTVAVAPTSFVGNERFQQTYTIVQANSLTGTFANGAAFTATPNDPSLYYRLRYDLVANAVVLQVQRQIDFAAALAGTGTANQTAVAGALNGTAGTASDAYAATLNAIAAAGNRGATLDSLSGEAIADINTSALFAAEKFTDLLQARLGLDGGGAVARGQYALRAGMNGALAHASGLAGSLGQEATADATANATGAGFWMQGFGAQRRLEGREPNEATTRSFAGGLAGGLDGRIGAFTVGAGGGFTHIDTTVDARASTVEGQLYQGGAYAGYDTGAFYLGVSGTYYGGDVTTVRQLTIGTARIGAASGRTNAHGYDVSGLAGVRFALGSGTQAAFQVSGAQTRATKRGYTETAPSGLALQVARDTRNLFTGEAELRLSHELQMGGATVTPYASAGVRVYAGDLQALDAMQLTGAPTGAGGFIVQGAKVSPVMGTFTGGLELKAADRFRIDLSAGSALANRTREGQVKVTARIGF